MHECLLCKRDMKVSNDVFGNGCVRKIYSFLDLQMPRKVNLREENLYKNIMRINKVNLLNHFKINYFFFKINLSQKLILIMVTHCKNMT